MSTEGHQQSIGGSGAVDGLSGTDNPGTEGADSGQGVNKGGAPAKPPVDGGADGVVGKPDADAHGAGPGQAGKTGDGLARNSSKTSNP